MLELWQTEWCPASQRIRERLTELSIDYLTHQVPVERERRMTLRQVTGSNTIPTLLLEDGTAIIGELTIRTYLDEQIVELPEVEAHRLKADEARRRYLEEECQCLRPATH